MLEPDFFGQEARQEAEAWSKMSAAAEADGAGEDYGGVGKDLDKDLGVLATQSGTLVPDGAADRFAHSAGPCIANGGLEYGI